MQTVNVALGSRSYPIDIGQRLLGDVSYWRHTPVGAKVMIVTDDNVAEHYLASLVAALGEREVGHHVVAPGETSKTVGHMTAVIDALVDLGARRDTTLIALGGGVVGDLTGFAAACFMRGIRFVQVPTTLLAQVDSSVGGKTGVNHPEGKNLIGAFHQPSLVVIDTDTLATLDDRELRAGAAEVIKSALLADADFFAWLEGNMAALLARDADALRYAIARCCEIKAAVVARDEREAGERMLLNLGHTFGHAIETLTGYGSWLHGEAVGAGLVMAADLSVRLGMLSEAARERVEALVAATGLPTRADGLPARDVRAAMSHDKKFGHNRTRFILLERLGTARVVEDADPGALDACLEACCA